MLELPSWLPGRRSRRAGEPHFLRDYRKLVRNLKRVHGTDRAMELGVGGQYETYGKIEYALLRHLGLKDGDTVVDVGCGSGRLSSVLSQKLDVTYHGTDVVTEFLDYARARARPGYRFSLVEGLTIPESDGAADFVTFFSVATHLQLHETYQYLKEAVRVARPGGRIVVSYLTVADHWSTFEATVAEARRGRLVHLNAFIEDAAWPVLARRLGLTVERTLPAGSRTIPIEETLSYDDGTAFSGFADLGQSAIVLQKPEAGAGKLQ